MQFRVGTSGYSYPGWKGLFYPRKLPSKEMLGYYSQRFSTVELNNTFYRMPGENTVASWAGEVPSNFDFAIKAPQTITHFKRLKDCKQELEQLFSTFSVLKNRLGPVLFQLPPNFKKDLPRLSQFLDLIAGRTAAFEFRHASWLDDEVFASLRAQSCALCVADVEGDSAPGLIGTADWGYVRLRRDGYADPELRQWIKQFRAQRWRKTYVYFKHDDVGIGAQLATRFLELAKE